MTVDACTFIPQCNPKASYLEYKTEIDLAIQKVLNSGWYILGQEVESFELEFAAYIGTRYAIGVANGTDALELSLRACGIGPGDLVYTVSHTAVATVAAIELAGATPVLLDIDPVTYTMDINSLKTALKQSLSGTPKAIIPVHLYGHPADMHSILDIAEDNDLIVIEDCAQSHGAKLEGRMTGSWGRIAAFSFYPTKNLGALGDGGIIVTDDDTLAERVRLLQQYGWRNRYSSDIPGCNSRLDEVQAAILRIKLRGLDEENSKRQTIGQTYSELLKNTGIKLPTARSDIFHVYHQYAICSPNRDLLKTELMNAGISTIIHYPLPVHLQPAYQHRLPSICPLPITERIAGQVLSLPMYPQLSNDQVRYVCEQISRFCY